MSRGGRGGMGGRGVREEGEVGRGVNDFLAVKKKCNQNTDSYSDEMGGHHVIGIGSCQMICLL